MLTQNTLETLRHLKLHGMAQALEEQRDTPNTHALSFEERLALLVDRERLSKEIAELEKVIANSQRQLSNEAFIAKAPEKIVAGMRQKQAEYETQLAKLRAAL